MIVGEEGKKDASAPSGKKVALQVEVVAEAFLGVSLFSKLVKLQEWTPMAVNLGRKWSTEW